MLMGGNPFNQKEKPTDKKSIMLRVKFGNNETTTINEQINNKIDSILKVINKKCKIAMLKCTLG